MNTTSAATAQTLPPLPDPAISYGPTDYHRGYTAEQMREYAGAAIAQRDERIAALEAALRFYASSCDASEPASCGYEGNLCCKTARAALAAAPAAQPVAWVESEPAARGASLVDVIRSVTVSTRWHWSPERPQTTNPVWPIYTSAPAAAQAETLTLQEAWEAAGGNPGIKPSRDDVLTTLRMLDRVCDEADAPAAAQARQPLTDELLWTIREDVALNQVQRADDGKTICIKHGRAVERACAKAWGVTLPEDAAATTRRAIVRAAAAIGARGTTGEQHG